MGTATDTFPSNINPSGILVPCLACQQSKKCAGCWCDEFICAECVNHHLQKCNWFQAKKHKLWGK